MKLNLPSLSKTASTPQMELSRRQESENTKWYKGDSPTRGETLAQIGKLYEQDQRKGLQAYKSFLTLSQDPSSAMYSPYMSATNNSTRQSFAQYGVDANNVNDAWFESNAWMKQYNRVGSTGNVLGTAKSATDAQNMASLYADLYDQEQATKKAETEWAALQDEVRYWASRADLNMSDEEILNKIDWSKYPTLSKMEEGAKSGAPMYTTRAVGYDKDLLKGVIYQTRNNGGSGDLLRDSASYYSGEGNQYVQDDAVRARFTYGSESYNPYVVSGTANDLGLYFGEGSFDREWLNANANILNGTDETAKKNYHKVQDAVALNEKADAELAQLNKQVDNMISRNADADVIMASVDRLLEDGTYPTLAKLQSSLSTGELLNTAAPINFDYAAMRDGITKRVNEKRAAGNANGLDTAAMANEASGIALVQQSGTEAENAFFDSMGNLDYDAQVQALWAEFEDAGVERSEGYFDRAYKTLADSFNKKWANQAEDVTADYAKHQEAVKAYFDAELAIEWSPEYKRLRELGYTGEVNDYAGVNAFLETIDEAEYDAIWEPLHDMYSDLAQADYTQDWNYMGGETGRAYRDDYAALEAFRRRAQIEGDESVVPILNKGEEYSVMDYAGVTADDYINSVMQSNEGVTSQEAASHVATALGEENAQLVKEISALETAGYKGDILDNKKRKLDANQRLLTGVEYYNLQDNADYAENVAAGADLIDTTKADPDSYKVTVDDDGNISLSLMVYNHMTEDEKERMQYLAATNPEGAKEYLLSLTDDTYGVIPARVSGAMREAGAKFAEDHPILATAASVVTSPLQLAGTAYSVVQGLRGKEINPNSRFFGASTFSNASRAQVIEDIDEATSNSPVLNFIAKGAYNAIASLAESFMYGGVGKLGLLTMVAANASQTVQDATARGANPVQALALGGVSAIIEYATEKIPFDDLMAATKGTKKAAGATLGRKLINVGKDAFKTGASDASGEALSEWLGNVADEYVMKDKSSHNIAVQEYMSENPEATEEEAERAVTKDELLEIGMAFFSGFLSGAAGVGVPETISAVQEGNAPAPTEGDAVIDAAEPEVVAKSSIERDSVTAKKSAALSFATMNRTGIPQAVTASLVSEDDATQTTAKAMTLDLQRVIGEDIGGFMRDVFGTAYDAGIADVEVVNAFKKHLSNAYAEGAEQIRALAQDGVSRGKLRDFIDQTKDAPVSYTAVQAREVIINERMQEIMRDGKNYEGLNAARAAETSAKDQYVKAQKAVGDATKRKTAAVGAMNSAKAAYDAALVGDNGNDLTSAQHAFMNSIDNVANINAALEAANKRMQEAKAKFDGAVQHYKDVGQRVLADIRARAEEDVAKQMALAEDKTVNDILAALPKMETQEGQQANVADAQRAAVEQMRADGMLDELAEINRQIEKLQKQIAGNRQNNAASKPLQKMLKQAQAKQAEIVSTVETLVGEEVARVQQTQAVEEAPTVMAEAVSDTGNTVTIPYETEDAVAPSVAPESTVPRHDEALEKYGRVAPGEKPVRDIPIARKITDELITMRGMRTTAEAFTEEQLPADVVRQLIADERGVYAADSNNKQIAWAQNILRSNGYEGSLQKWVDAVNADRIPNAQEIALGSMLVHEAVGRGDMANATKLMVELAEAENRAGQAVQASRIMKNLGNEANLYYVVRAENQINRMLAPKGYSVAVDEQLAKQLLDAKTDEEKQAAVDAIVANLATQLPRTKRDMLNSLAYLAMLSSPVTHVKNFAGNATFVPMAVMENMAGTFIDQFRSASKRTHVAKVDDAYMAFAKADMAESREALKGDRYKIDAGIVKAAQTPFKDKGVGKALNKISAAESALLSKGDNLYKSLYYPRLLAGYLQAQKVDLNNIPAATLAKARAYAERKTKEYVYQDDNAFSNWLQKGYKLPVVGGALRAIMPFAKTPVNVARRSLEYSVIGGVANIVYQGQKNGWSSNEVVEAISKTAAGGALTLAGFFLRNAGMLTPSLGDEPEDKMAKLRGEQAYSLNVGGRSYTLSWTGPAAIELMLGAEIADVADGEFALEDLMDAGFNLLNPILENTFMDGITDLMSVGQYADGSAGVWQEAVTQVASNYVAQYVPAFLGSAARTLDGTRRSTTTNPNSIIPETMQYQFAKAMNKIPGLTFSRPVWTDEFGQEDVTEGLGQRFLENFVFPWYQNELKDSDPVLDAINKAYIATGDKSLIPESADKSFSESSAKHKLSGDDYAVINEKRGQIQRDALEGLISSPEWSGIDPLIQAEMIKDVYNYADNASRVDYMTLSPFSENWQADAYKNGTIVETILGRAEKYAESALGNLYATELVDFAVRGDWEAVTDRMFSMTASYPAGAGLSSKQMRSKIESKLKTKLQEGDAEITPEEYDAVLQLYALGYIDSTIVDELMAQ